MNESVIVWKSKYFYFRYIVVTSIVALPWLCGMMLSGVWLIGIVLLVCVYLPAVYSLRVPVLCVLDNKIKISHMYWFESEMDITDELKVSYGPDVVYFRSDGKEVSLQRHGFNPNRWEEIAGELKECLGQ